MNYNKRSKRLFREEGKQTRKWVRMTKGVTRHIARKT